MIVPMKKVTLLALGSECENALTALRALGVMQIQSDSQASDVTAAAGDELARMKHIYSMLEQLAVDEKLPAAAPGNAAGAQAVADRVSVITDRQHSLNSELIDVRRRLEALAIWGDFDRELLDKLNASGINVLLCLGNARDFQQASAIEGVECREIAHGQGKVAFAVISTEKIDAENLPVVKLAADDDPRKLSRTLRDLEKEAGKIEAELIELAGKRGDLAAAVDDLTGIWEFAQARDALDGHGEIVSLSGFVPIPELDALRNAAAENGWGLLIRDPAEEEDVPVLLKNNKFTRIIKPLFDFLGIVPGYREIDISGAVLIFFTLFYAIIIGDAGYGIVFGGISLFGLCAARKNPKLLPPMRLLLILSIAATIWGALCGSWFGFSQIGDWQVPALACFRDFASETAKQANIQFFCFVLAVIQLSAGRIWRVVSEKKWRAAGQHLGWMLIIWGNFFLTIRLIVYPGEFPSFMYALYGIGLLMVIICGVNWGNAADVFQFPFDIIGSFTDVLSYIRLFAVGLAGACIAGSFNGMALDISKISLWLIPAGILVAVIGHVLNIVLALLSVLVHAVRLNTLEFSNHTGLSWSGQTFNPFKLNKKEE